MNAQALQGQARFDGVAVRLAQVAYLPLFTIVLLAALAFHAIVGLTFALQARPDTERRTAFQPWLTTLQWVTGLIAFAFIAFHLWEIWAQKAMGRIAADQLYATLSEDLSSTYHGVPITALVYLIGVAAVVLHFANGLWRAGVAWGFTVSQRAQRSSATVLGMAAVALFLFGANTVVYFATGSAFRVLGAAPRSAESRN
jgi:succinate dehydrogenase/fumarate reductase cytochrome b subunit (b558 family)